MPSHLFICHTWTFRVASTSSVSSALQNQILNKSGRSHWSYVTEEGRRAIVPLCRKLRVELQQQEFANGPHGQLCCYFRGSVCTVYMSLTVCSEGTAFVLACMGRPPGNNLCHSISFIICQGNYLQGAVVHLHVGLINS